MSYWLFKGLTTLTIITALDYIHYQDFHGRLLSATLILLAPYIVSLCLPRTWLACSLAIPISAALVMCFPILVSFAWGFHTDRTQDLKLFAVLIAMVILPITAIIAGMLNRDTIKARIVLLSLGASLIYYLAAVQYAR